MHANPAEHVRAFRQTFLRFLSDYRRVFHASKGLAPIIFLTSAYLGLLPVFETTILSRLLDAIISARGVKTFLTEVDTYFWYQIALFMSLMPASVFLSQLKGVVARLARETVEGVAVLSLIFIAMMHAPVTTILLLLLAVASFIIANKWARWTLSALSIILLIQPLSQFVQAGAFADVTVGGMAYMSLSLAMLGIWLALRPYVYAYHY